MEHIKHFMPSNALPDIQRYTPEYFRSVIPQLQQWDVSDETIERHRAMLLEYLREVKVCADCRGFEHCGKEGDMQGFTQHLSPYRTQLAAMVQRCQPYQEYSARQRLQKWAEVSGGLAQDESFQFSNFPAEQQRKYPRLLHYAQNFADTFDPAQSGMGLYIFGPPGVGKTHLMLAVLNRLRERGVPCLFVRSDSIFDRMRHMIADNGDLEPLLEAYATAPVLGIDEFAQERANEFTLEKLFRIVNQRFHANLPTWFTSNYAPPDIYRKAGVDIHDSVAPLRSRILKMTKLAKMDGEDARQRNLELLT